MRDEVKIQSSASEKTIYDYRLLFSFSKMAQFCRCSRQCYEVQIQCNYSKLLVEVNLALSRGERHLKHYEAEGDAKLVELFF